MRHVRLGAVVTLGVATASCWSCASGPSTQDRAEARREARDVAEVSSAGGEATADPPPSSHAHEDRRGARPVKVLRGEASYYADSLAGHRTASGERYDPHKLTAAHRSLPFGTRVRVVRVDDGRSVVVRINDRGPFGHNHRILDLSRAAAKKLGMLADGVVTVRAEVLP